MTLSVVVPAYNEVDTLEEILYRVQTVDVEKEIIVVDDGSTDGTRDLLRDIEAAEDAYSICDGERTLNPSPIQVIYHDRNQGKGAALNTGFDEVEGDVAVIQDADLEYDPRDYETMLRLIERGDADVVYGSRFRSGKPHRVLYFWHFLGNQFLTMLSNAFTNLNLTDMETCYKMIRTDFLEEITLQEQQFGIEPEITAKLAAIPGIRIYEVGISYHGRTYAEGKKITALDGIRAVYCIVRYNLFSS
ncbi:MAG TPA: glycosyltransferase family 2 protein [Salinibacter sp.]|nr:glycosyltransferase family 2 protein [Salinibacter sp.]